MYTPFLIEFNLQYGPYAHFGYWTLVSDPDPNKVFKKMKSYHKKKVIFLYLKKMKSYYEKKIVEDGLVCAKVITLNRAAFLKSHVIKKHYAEVEPVKVPVVALQSENKQSDTAVRMRHLLDWTREITGRVQRRRHQWFEGWDVVATVFRQVPASSQYNPGEPGLYQAAHISMVPGAIYAVLDRLG